MKDANPSATADAQEIFRPLKWNELVKRGDFVEDGKQGLELWFGPTGFRADAFVKTIYRRNNAAATGAGKSS
jgi:hypothetical protein